MGTSDNVLSGALCPPVTHGTHGETRSVLMCDFQAAPGNHGNVTPETKGEQVRQAAHSSLDDSRPQTAPCRVPSLSGLLHPAGVRPASVSGDKVESAGTMAPQRNVGCADFLSPWFPSSLPSCPSSPSPGAVRGPQPAPDMSPEAGLAFGFTLGGAPTPQMQGAGRTWPEGPCQGLALKEAICCSPSRQQEAGAFSLSQQPVLRGTQT